jgi:hypothetical protein
MRRKPLSILAVIVLSGLVLAASGCGGSKQKAAATTTAATTTAATTTAATTTAQGTTTATTSKGSSLSGLANAANCSQLAGLSTSFAQAMAGTGKADVKKTAALLKQFADRTPKEIRADFEVVAAAYAKIAEALKGVDLTSGKTPSADVIAKLTKLSSEIDTAALSKASANIGAWAQKNCTTK